MERWCGGRGLPARSALGRPVRLALLAGSSLSWRRGGCSQPGSGWWLCPPSPLHLQNQWAGPRQHWAHPAGGGTDKSIRSNPCPLAAASTSTTNESQRDAPVGLHHDMWIDNVYLKGLGFALTPAVDPWLPTPRLSLELGGSTPDASGADRSRGSYFWPHPNRTSFLQAAPQMPARGAAWWQQAWPRPIIA